jgi:hypothetical protein
MVSTTKCTPSRIISAALFLIYWQIIGIVASAALAMQPIRPTRTTEGTKPMLKLALISVASAALSAVATFQATTATVVAEDRCRIYGYQVCIVIDGVSLPETTDARLRAEMTRHVRQMIRDRSRD